MDLILKWIGIITIMFLIGKLIKYLLKKAEIKDDISWKEMFNKKQ